MISKQDILNTTVVVNKQADTDMAIYIYWSEKW